MSEEQQTINIDDLVKHVTEHVTKRIGLDIDAKLSIAVDSLKTISETKKERITLTGKNKFSLEADADGLCFANNDKLSMIIGKNGQIGSGTRSPRTVGKGSAHFKMGNSEAVMPTSGKHSTRGVLVESDADDDNTFSLRAVSKTNRQGFNVFGDGSIGIKTMDRLDNSTLSLYHKEGEEPCLTFDVATKDYTASAFNLKVNAPRSDSWDAMNISSNTGDDDSENNLMKVSGTGSLFIEGSLHTNVNGYAEMFEWADGNHRDEDRYGIAVALDDNGKLIVATENNPAIGVVVPHASVIGNTQWNNWVKKYRRTEFGEIKQHNCTIIEWNEDETGILKSYYGDSLNENFATPPNAIELQTNEFGEDLKIDTIRSAYKMDSEYAGRHTRQEWSTVCLLGSVPVYKGQAIQPNWILVKQLSDELDLMIVK